MIASPNMGVSSQAAKKTHSRVRVPQGTNKAKPKATHRGEFIDVDLPHHMKNQQSIHRWRNKYNPQQ
jgi:hypothetical protein